MGTENNSDGGDNKPDVIKSEGAGKQQQRRYQRKQYPKKERFNGAHADLMGSVFTAASTRSNQIHQFTKTEEHIKALIGHKYDPYVLQSLEEGKVVMPVEPTATKEPDGSVTKENEMKFNKKFERWLTLSYQIEKELKQSFNIYYGQCDDDMKASLAENPTFEAAFKSKDVIELHKILQSVNFSYSSTEEPIFSMWKTKSDFVKLRQHKGQSVTDYYERFVALKDVNDTLETGVHDDKGFVNVIAKEKGTDLTTLSTTQLDTFTKDAISEGKERMLAIHFIMGFDLEWYWGLLSRT